MYAFSHCFSSCFVTPPLEPIQKHIARENFYTPTYDKPPSNDLDFQQILFLAQKRNTFHRRVEFESHQNPLDFMSLRALSVDFGIPFKKFSINSVEVATDHASFYSLFLMSLYNSETMNRFADDEERLLYYRLRTSAVSITQIDPYFWPSMEIRNYIISSHLNCCEEVGNNETFQIPFEKALLFFDPTELLLKNGIAYVNNEAIYHMVCNTFKNKILNKMESFPIENFTTLIESLNEEKEKVDDQTKGILTLENLFDKCEKSFPPCMYRIIKSVTKSNYATFKGRFELSLFMKSLGMDYYQQYEFWKTSLFRSNDVWHFESQIVQLLKQIYGLDEAEEDYAPQKCVTIINHDKPSSNKMIQSCPFSCLQKADLKIFLKKMRRGVKHADIDELAIKAQENPHEACKIFFNKKFIELPINDADFEKPSHYFNESEKRLTGN